MRIYLIKLMEHTTRLDNDIRKLLDLFLSTDISSQTGFCELPCTLVFVVF